MGNISVLIVDDEKGYALEIAEFLQDLKYKVDTVFLPSTAFKKMEKNNYDLVILDLKLPEMDGLEVLKIIKKDYPNTEVIIITGHGEMNSVIEAFRFGALDFINKPFGAFEIQSSIERSKKFIDLNANLQDIKEKYIAASQEIRNKFGHDIIGISDTMKNILDLMTKVANTDNTSVMISGESGTGKELVARGIHNLSVRNDKFFYDVNCSAIPDTLFESEFFGHTKGAFTGAVKDKPGWFEIANKGTLFLDEIGDMPLNQQIKLLRVLETKKVRRVGSHREITVDVRVIAATNHDLLELVKKKTFRIDLFHRLNTFSIHIPPLRERRSDIPVLLQYYTNKLAKKLRKNVKRIDNNAIEKLMVYDFPGNVRELKNMVEKALIISDTDILQYKHFALSPLKNLSTLENIYDLEELEKKAIIEVIKITRFKKQAAKLLNITVQTLDRRLHKYGINI